MELFLPLASPRLEREEATSRWVLARQSRNCFGCTPKYFAVARRETPAARFLFNSNTIWSLAPLVYRFLAIFFAFLDEKTEMKKVIGGRLETRFF